MSSTIRSIIRRIGKGDGFDNSTTYPDATLDEWIADAQQDVPVSAFGTKADRAVAYYAAGLMFHSSSSVSGSGGAVKRKKLDERETEWATGNSVNGMSNKYFDMYAKLKTSAGRRPSPMVLNGR